MRWGPSSGNLRASAEAAVKKARMAAHDDRAIDPFERLIVEIGAGEGLRHEASGGWIARHMIEADEVVVDRLGNVYRAQSVIRLLRLFGDDPHGVRGIVAANVEERVDRVRFQDLEDLLAIFEVGFVARRAEGSGGRGGDRFEVGDGLLAEIDKIVVDDAAHPVLSAIDAGNAGEPPRLERHADQRLVDHRGRAAPLGDDDLVRHESLPCPASRAMTSARVRRLYEGRASRASDKALAAD